jgi:hypothetical protein
VESVSMLVSPMRAILRRRSRLQRSPSDPRGVVPSASRRPLELHDGVDRLAPRGTLRAEEAHLLAATPTSTSATRRRSIAASSLARAVRRSPAVGSRAQQRRPRARARLARSLEARRDRGGPEARRAHGCQRSHHARDAADPRAFRVSRGPARSSALDAARARAERLRWGASAPSLTALVECLGDDEQSVVSAAHAALCQISGRELAADPQVWMASVAGERAASRQADN